MPDEKNNPSNNNQTPSDSNSNPYNDFINDIDSPPITNMRPIWEGFTLNKDSEKPE